MIAWMAYATGVGVVLGIGALLAEAGLRRLGHPVRWVWLIAMVGTVGIPAVILVAEGAGAPAPVSASGADTFVEVGWAVLTLVLLASLQLSAWTLRRNVRSWRGWRLHGRRVLVSTAFGPGVIGALEPRVVLPGWVAEAPAPLRRLVVRHELEHVRARDTALLLAGIVLAVLVPWCLPLWWQLHRLRTATETDCDARVMAGEDPRAYANVLVAIAGRPPRPLLPVPTLAPRAAELERRIRLITRQTGPDRPGSRRAGLALLALALAVVLPLAIAPAPAARPAPIVPALWLAPPTPPVERPRGATVILSAGPAVFPAPGD